MFQLYDKSAMVSEEKALPGRLDKMPVAAQHSVLGTPLSEPEPGFFVAQGLEQAVFGLGCFWGAERVFWSLPGVYTTAVGYAGGFTPNPSYREVCTGQTAHTEVVWVVYDPSKLSYQQLLEAFWQAHNPTQGMAQGNDHGTQYRSMILSYNDEQLQVALESKQHYQEMLNEKGFAQITTEIEPLTEFYYAEDDHQQYLAKNPNGYCGLGGTGVCY